MPRKPAQPPELLAEIADRYSWAIEFWRPIHVEGNKDVSFIAGDPWDPRDVQARETLEQKRPHLVFDEGSQYVNMFCGQAAQQKRSPKVDPVDETVDGDTAVIWQGRLHHIEYASRGQEHCIKALRDCATRSYGWISIRKKYSSDTGREQEPCYNPVANPDSRLMDPMAKEEDGSDAEFLFVRDPVKKSYVKSKWKWARNLGVETERTVTLIEYWKVEKEVVDTVYLLDAGTPDGSEIKKSVLQEQGAEIGSESVTIKGKEFPILDERDIEDRSVTKYLCQIVEPVGAGYDMTADAAAIVEILEVEPWDGKYIPEIPVLGPAYYINDSGTAKCVRMSLLRRAREPMQLLNLTRTNEAEMVAMTPKTRFLGYEGQFEGHEDEFANIGTSPISYLQVKASADPLTDQVLPLPTVIRWEPPIQALELLANSCMNAIRSAIGQLASPELDKTKSGVALNRIQATGESSVYQFIDRYENALMQAGRVMGDLMERTHDTKRSVAIRKPSGEQDMVTINAPYDRKVGGVTKRVHYPIKTGGFAYTITTGPSYQSQFQEASDFVNTLVQGIPTLLIDGSGHTTLGDLAIKLKNLGPIGDEIVDRFKKMLRPELAEATDIPPQAQAELQKGQQMINLLTEQVNKLKDVIQNKSMELESEERRNEQDNKTKIAVAEINAQVKENIAQLQESMAAIANQMNQQWEAMKGAGQPTTQTAIPGEAPSAAPSEPQEPELQPTHTFDPNAQELQPVGANA